MFAASNRLVAFLLLFRFCVKMSTAENDDINFMTSVEKLRAAKENFEDTLRSSGRCTKFLGRNKFESVQLDTDNEAEIIVNQYLDEFEDGEIFKKINKVLNIQ